MHDTRRTSIRLRVVGTFALLILAVTAFQVVYFPARYEERALQGLHDKAMSICGIASHAVSPALDFDDREGANQAFQATAKDPELAYIALFQSDGTTLGGINPEKAAAARTRAVEQQAGPGVYDGVYAVTCPVLSTAGAKGLLALGFVTERIEAQIRRNRLITVALGLIVLALGLVVSFSIGAFVAGRIAAMEDIASKVAGTAVEIQAAAKEIFASSRQQEHGATEQSSAVEETRRTLQGLLESGRQITTAAQAVLKNAEATQRTNQTIAERIGNLSTRTSRITEILEVIKDIATKSELLALNAALEGTKAGEAGRGFSLVATQMQRLAENVMGAVGDIKTLTNDIREATGASVFATEEAKKVAADTTRSAQQIALIIQQQQSGTEQVFGAMDDVAKIAQQTAGGSKQAVEAIGGLLQLSDQFEQLVKLFRANPTSAVEAKRV